MNECFFWFYTFLIFFVICRDYTFCFLRFKIFHVYKLKKSSLYHLPLGGVGPGQGGGHEDGHGRHHHGHLAHPQHGLQADHLPRNRWIVFASLSFFLLCQSYSVSSWSEFNVWNCVRLQYLSGNMAKYKQSLCMTTAGQGSHMVSPHYTLFPNGNKWNSRK